MRGSRSIARTAGVVATCALLAALGWAAFGRDGRAAAPLYVTEAADRGPITVTVTATGVVEPVRTVQVGTYVSGPILALYADFNSAVTKGQLVAQIDPATFQVKVRQADANLGTARAKAEKARADLVLKKLSLDRARELNGRDLLARDELDTAESNEAQARAQLALEEAGIAQAEAALEEARIQLGYTDIRLPRRRHRDLAHRRRRPDGGGELPDADAVRDRRGPREDARARERQRVGHRGPRRGAAGLLRRRRLAGPELRGARRAGAQRPGVDPERGHLRRLDRGGQRVPRAEARHDGHGRDHDGAPRGRAARPAAGAALPARGGGGERGAGRRRRPRPSWSAPAARCAA